MPIYKFSREAIAFADQIRGAIMVALPAGARYRMDGGLPSEHEGHLCTETVDVIVNGRLDQRYFRVWSSEPFYSSTLEE